MDFKIFSIKDFFNYYFAGIVWIFCAIMLLIIKSYELKCIFEIIGKVPVAVLVTLLLVIPFIIGFIFCPLAALLTKLLLKIFGDPVDWVLVLKGDKYPERKNFLAKIFKFKKRLSEPIRLKILEKHKTLLGDYPKYSPLFFVRNYTESKANDNTRLLINRSLDMANLTESLIIPITILGYLIGVTLALKYHALVLGAILFTFLSYRYFHLREYWVKHCYRSFIIIE